VLEAAVVIVLISGSSRWGLWQWFCLNPDLLSHMLLLLLLLLLQVRPSVVSGREVWQLLQQHLTGHMLRVGGTFLQQRTGIAQVKGGEWLLLLLLVAKTLGTAGVHVVLAAACMTTGYVPAF
jgi:hypothetical protein